jgi:hypothetical protein
MGDRFAVVVLAGVLAAAAAARADEGTATEGAVRVRVTASDRRLKGEVVSIDAAALVLRRSGESELARIPLASITSIERRLRPSRRQRGLGIGFLAGAAAGAVAGFAAGDDCGRGGKIVCFDRRATAGAGALAFGLLGMAVGAAVAPGEKWEATTTEQLRLDVGKTAKGGVGARLTVRF